MPINAAKLITTSQPFIESFRDPGSLISPKKKLIFFFDEGLIYYSHPFELNELYKIRELTL